MQEIKFIAELTDTYGGESNYAWVIRKDIPTMPTTTDRALIRRAKSALGISKLRHIAHRYGDDIKLQLIGANMVAHIYPE
jgi:hypothetical protein